MLPAVPVCGSIVQCVTIRTNGQLEWEVGSNRVIEVSLHLL